MCRSERTFLLANFVGFIIHAIKVQTIGMKSALKSAKRHNILYTAGIPGYLTKGRIKGGSDCQDCLIRLEWLPEDVGQLKEVRQYARQSCARFDPI